MDVISSLALLGYGLFIHRFTRWPTAALPFFLVSLVITIFYLFAYVHFLYFGSLIFIYGGIAALALSSFYLFRKEPWQEYLTPGLIIFIVYLCVFGWIAHHLVATYNWDEIGRWLPHAKAIYWNHGFWQAADPINDKDYPPGSALFYYFFLRTGGYFEGRICFAHLFFILAPLAVLLVKYKWNEWLNALILYTVIISGFVYFFNVQIGFSTSLLVDNIIGCFFGGIIASYFILSNVRYFWLYLLIPTIALVLFKPMLFPFALLIMLLIALDQRIVSANQLTKNIKRFWYLEFLAFPGLFLISWFIYLKHIKVGSPWNYLSLPSTISKSMHSHISMQDYTAKEQFSTVLNQYLQAMKYPMLFLGVMLALSIILFFLFNDKLTRKRFMTSQIIIATSYLAFLGMLLVLYLFKMPSYVSLTVVSADRFINIYYLAWTIIFIAQILQFSENIKFLTLQYVSALKYLVLGLLLFAWEHAISTQHRTREIFYENQSNLEYLRAAMRELSLSVKKQTEKKTSIAFLWAGDSFPRCMIAYELLPKKVEIINADSNNTINFSKIIANNDYVLLGRVQPDFWKKYHVYFSQQKKPLTYVSLCTDNELNFAKMVGQQQCRLHQIPVYLYKKQSEQLISIGR